MLKILPLTLMTVCLALPSCSDGGGAIQAVADGPQAPINDPDTGIFEPSNPGNGGNNNANTNAPAGSEAPANEPTSSGTGNTGGSGLPGPGASNPTGKEGTGGSGNGNGSGNAPGNEPGGPGGGGQPVPEPSTLLLVGSGIAGISASLLRRRRKQRNQD